MASKSITIKDYRTQIGGQIDPTDKTIYTFPLIKSTNTHGTITFWRIIVRLFDVDKKVFIPIIDAYFDSETQLEKNIIGFIKVVSKIGEGGVIRDNEPTFITEGKSLTRSNRTNVFTQALRDALGLHNKQVKKSKNITEQKPLTNFYPPMLVKNITDIDNEKLEELFQDSKGVFIQPKLDGVRAIATRITEIKTIEGKDQQEDKVVLYSRKMNVFPGFEYIERKLLPVLREFALKGRNVYLDGELFKLGKNLQEISGQARKEAKDRDFVLEYHIYDLFIPEEKDLSYAARMQLLHEMFLVHRDKLAPEIVEVPTIQIKTPNDIDDNYKRFRAQEYEGAIIRFGSPNYKYSYHDHHCKHLLKKKPLFDAEFKIVDYEAGKRGKEKGALIIVCKTDAGKIFNVRPFGKQYGGLKERRDLYNLMSKKEENGKTHFENQWKDKPLIVFYEDLSEDKVPLRARTEMVLRTYE